MENLFEVLSLPTSLTIPDGDVEQAWRTLSQEHHPDAQGTGNADVSAKLNQARDVLSKPASRLSHWLQVKGVESLPRNAALNEDLMSLFSSVNEVLAEADTTIASLKKAQTALAKSLLTPGAIAAQKHLQTCLGDITGRIGQISSRFPEFEKDAGSSVFDAAAASLGELKFLDKWQKECQQRLLELIAI
ncbi:MAG: hypothetical protein P1U89_23835 [Verrucomicrobiales bacterium]|nr:hypothetical protein [Verrucomicrobiales bacterium]